MQIRLFRGSGEPAWVNALSSACERLGPDPRRALGPAAIPAASTGRTRDRTRPMLHNVRKFLPGRRPHVTQSGHGVAKDLIDPEPSFQLHLWTSTLGWPIMPLRGGI